MSVFQLLFFNFQLHQYPGYDPTELTPLPDDIAAVDILKKAADASMDLKKKVNMFCIKENKLFIFLIFPKLGKMSC